MINTLLNPVLNDGVKQMIDNSVINGKVFPSYIFAGTDRESKLHMSKYLASVLNCTGEVRPCNKCSNCKAINDGKFHSFKLISKESEADSEKETKKKSISADDIRELRLEILSGSYQGYLLVYIDHAEDLTPVALNGLLKILEDIPDKVVFVFDVANKYSLLSTIRSRSQVIIFGYKNDLELTQEISKFISVDKFNDFIENNTVHELLLYVEENKFDRSEVKDFLIKLESYYLELFKRTSINKFLHLSGIVRKYHLYLNRPVSVDNNLVLMLIEMKG